MTKALQDAFKEAEKLPDAEQDQLAAAIHAEIEAKHANGADKVVQRYLQERGFEKVEVFSADASPGNNLGRAPTSRPWVSRPAERLPERVQHDIATAHERWKDYKGWSVSLPAISNAATNRLPPA